MSRAILGWFLILHAFAHALAGLWSTGEGSMWPATILWSFAFAAYITAGLGLLRVPRLRRWWKQSLLVATAASITMIAWYHPPWGMPGVAFDVVLMIVTLAVLQQRIDAEIDVIDAMGANALRHPRWVRTGWFLGVAVASYAAIVMLTRPICLRWGSISVERASVLPGDDVHPRQANYRIDHAILVRAPASQVWSWVVQLGQDRAGFYSYDWLERMFGDDIRNADRVHPEWQHRQVGDTILATQRSYLGGRFGTLGWRVTTIDSARVMGLEQWGTFVLQPIDSNSTRLIVRTRNVRSTGVAPFLFAPLEVFLFEPAHFIMERGMLRGIRDRAERGSAAG